MAETSAQQVLAEDKAQAPSVDVLEQLKNPEVQASLAVLIDNLPKLTELAVTLSQTYDLVKTLANDQVFVEDMKGGLTEFIKPIEHKVKECASAAIEANERAEKNTAPIGIMGMMKMLKDPQVQHTLRFAQAFLDITAERKSHR